MEVAPATGDAPPATDPLATPAGVEEEGEASPASPVGPQGPSAPAPEAGFTVIALDFDVEVTRMAEEPEAIPAPSPAAPAVAAAATTAATGMASDDAPAAADAAGADSSAPQQGAVPAGAAATPPAPQTPGAGEGEVAEEDQQDAVPQADDPPAQPDGGGGGFFVAKAEEVHRKALATVQARLDEKSDLITSYVGQIQGLRVKLEVQTKATESAVTAAARHEIQLNATKDKVARLETELAALREELT
ncbi:skin secretory protein xP2-like [Brachypodium distachyon]|uniref:skin secretory protein xP2-like n=1 Tax=Brachypodium distachyon TaxID=15368 RepID=UPI00052FE332|nr:skin secretory protein xP2-like [Brachypodium distachyon]|eukprot:XP_010230056.1 skin secretory protein xP2-like [Brachypodium distachyon]